MRRAPLRGILLELCGCSNILPHPAKQWQIFRRGIRMSQDLLKSVDAPINPNIPELRAGDVVNVHVRITEGNRQRVQVFKGTVIRTRGGTNNANFTVRRVASNGIGVERTFLARSPLVEKVEVERHSHVRRARLYFLRERTGKRARLKQKFS